MLVKNKEFLRSTAIQSKTITEPFLQITIPYRKFVEDEITVYDSLLKPDSDERNYKSSIDFIKFNNDKDTTNIRTETYLRSINEMFHFQIDSNTIESDLILVTNGQNRLDWKCS